MPGYVLVGGPCTGKTTLLQEMAKRGYKVVEESAREIIAEKQRLDPDFRTTDDVLSFQLEVMRRQLEKEARLNWNEVYVLDHGVPSGIAYLRARSVRVPDELIKNSSNRNYRIAFLVQPIGKYTQDKERKETEEEARILHELTAEVYREFGYFVREIPAMSVRERADLVERAIKADLLR